MASPTPCYHCGLPVPAGGRFQARVLGETRAMCCPGCQAVAEAIVAGGLESYYQHRSEASANPQALPVQLVEELALYDRPDVQKPFVRHEGEQAETTLLIEGISCAACGWLIEKHLRELSSISAANLNLSNHRLYLSWDDSQLALSQILQTLRSIGYAAHPYQADQAVEQLAQENRRALRGFVSAYTFKHAHAVVQCMGQHVRRGITPRHQLAVIPDHTITISHRHHYAPQRIQHLHHWVSGKLDGAYGPAGYVLTALTLCVSQQPSSILARTRCVARVDARRQIDPP